MQVNVLYVLPAWLGRVTSHPLVKTHPDRSSITLIVYGTPHVPFKYKRRIRSAGFRDVVYGKKTVVSFRTVGVFLTCFEFFLRSVQTDVSTSRQLCFMYRDKSGNRTSCRPRNESSIHPPQICSGDGRSSCSETAGEITSGPSLFPVPSLRSLFFRYLLSFPPFFTLRDLASVIQLAVPNDPVRGTL